MFCRRDVLLGKKGGPLVGKTKRGKGTKCLVLVDGEGTPLGSYLDSASPAEVTLLEATLKTVAVPKSHTPGRPRQNPDRIIADRGYDSDPLRERLSARGIELIVPHKCNRVKPATQDGRSLRRYKRRWIVERTFAWLQCFRHLLVRWDRLIEHYAGFVHLACAMLTLRRVMQ
jgi:transposase